MPATPTYPGIYLEEIPSGVSAIAAVTTSVAAFVGYTPRGPLETPVTLTSFADFERTFGGLSPSSVLSYTVQHFFASGGAVAIVVRLATGSAAATGKISAGRSTALTVTARDPGSWGGTLRVATDNNTQVEGTFNLSVFDLAGTVSESYHNLSMAPGDPRFVEQIVNSASTLISVQAAGSNPPDPSGTVSNPIPAVPAPAGLRNKTVTAAIGPHKTTFPLYDPQADGAAPATPGQLAMLLEAKIRRGGGALGGVRVSAVGARLHARGATDDVLSLTGDGATDLGLAGTASPGARPLAGGADGSRPAAAADIIGSADDKTGLYSLLDVMDVNLLCLPDLADPALAGARVAVLSAADQLCRDKRMFLIVDSPAEWQSLPQARAGLAELDPVRSDHSALYFPQVRLTDPLSGLPRSFPPCGVIAGMMAATDGSRGVWKAPAGTSAALTGVLGLTVPLTDPENGLLNPLGVNCLRSFPIIGPVVWGARTLQGADALASDWKYIAVRRTALMIEESLYRGTKWVLFEPNDERLWGQIRLNVGAFMQSLFRQGAFQGSSARNAYLVKCDGTTTTQDDINKGIVNIIVGFAPLKPAEFVFIKIQQTAGQA
ncbi:MAG TPA: phage tail sheath C-terminal domain-containing protein [Trebonia sp.]|nr:phage tail sheath C-terminal domain-containing protein [Trebonia sp.]